jgi:RNA polymerase sigma factor (sigma-70 family)
MSEHLQQAMQEYGEYCIRVAYFYVKDWTAAEEVVQDVFLAYAKNSEKFEQRSSLKTYLVKITVHKSHDYLRSWKRKWQQFTQVKTFTHSIETEKVIDEEKQTLVQGLLQLPVHYREALILYYYDDYNIPEIASILQVSENTIKTRLVRGREKLKQLLQETNWEVLQVE